MEKIDFLPEKYTDLSGSKPVERAVQKKIQEGKKGSTSKAGRVEAYIDRLEDIIQNERGFELLKYKILEKYTTKFEDITESYWKSLEQEARRRGEGGDWDNANTEQIEEVKKTNAEAVLNDQRSSLEQWVDYFGSPNSNYVPSNLKYWIFRNIVGMQELVKKKEDEKEYIEFPKRSRGTVKPFPDINHEALAYVVDVMVKKFEGKVMEFEHDIQLDEREAFNAFIAKENFSKLYAWANELMNPIPEHLLPITEGEWVKYDQGSDPQNLAQTIRGKGTGWCIAGLNTVSKYLQAGDHYVYYTLDDEGNPSLPRLCIRMEGHDKIAEDPRGIAYKQNIDPYMTPILEKKLQEFGQIGEAYKKKSEDMKALTAVENKLKNKQELNKADLEFLYEVNSKIEGFGYKKDPRISELRKDRNVEEDILVIFEYTKEQIACVPSEISENTKAYVGQLEPGIFQKLPEDLEHVYVSFPEKKIRRDSVEVGGKSKEQLITEMKSVGINISDLAKSMMENPDFIVGKNREEAKLVRLTVADLGFKSSATTDQIYERAEVLGLELCPPDTGPNYSLKYKDQPLGKYVRIGMKQIAGYSGHPHVFDLYRDGDGSWLGIPWTRFDDEWSPDDEFVFRFRKVEA